MRTELSRDPTSAVAQAIVEAVVLSFMTPLLLWALFLDMLEADLDTIMGRRR